MELFPFSILNFGVCSWLPTGGKDPAEGRKKERRCRPVPSNLAKVSGGVLEISTKSDGEIKY